MKDDSLLTVDQPVQAASAAQPVQVVTEPGIKVPEYMMQMVRGRNGVDPDDRSRDDAILKSKSPEDVVRDCARWRLGDSEWADQMAAWMYAVGAKPERF